MNRKDTIKTIIVDNQNRHDPVMWERTLQIPSDSKKIVTLTGVRRSGKTYHLLSLVHELINNGTPKEHILYINFEDERIQFSADELDLILQAYRELYPDTDLSTCFFFFDEIQEVDGWEKFIARLYESISKHVFITGSNAKLLSQEIATALRGRTITYEVFPLSFAEFVTILAPGTKPHSSKDKALLSNLFEQFMYQGGFPELLDQSPDIRDKTLQEYFNVMVLRDLIERYNISGGSILKYFCKRVVAATGGEFSVHKIYNELRSQGYHVSKDTLYAYQDYAESVYLNRLITKYSFSVVKSENARKKTYVIDQGLGVALDYKCGQDVGRILETTVALELLKQGSHIAYQHNGSECDFVIMNKGVVTAALQVSVELHDNSTYEREIKGLKKTCQAYNLTEGVIITKDYRAEHKEDGIYITMMPAWEYFIQ